MRFYPHPFTREETDAWIERATAQVRTDGHSLWAVCDRATGAFLGNVGPARRTVDGVDEVELGWSITPSGPARASHRRLPRRAATGAGTTWTRRHLISLVLPANEPSRGVAERIGMTVWKETAYGSLGLAPPRLPGGPPAARDAGQSTMSIRSMTMSSAGWSCAPVSALAIASTTS